jgi:TM2 domain-containing membrane protein YozV
MSSGEGWRAQERYAKAQPRWEPLPLPGEVMQPAVTPRSPALSVLLSVFVPGVGSMVNDNAATGALILLLSILGFWLSIALIGIPLLVGTWIWGLVSAYRSARRWNAAHGITR